MIIIIIIILRKLELLSSEMMKMLIRDKGPVGSEQRGGSVLESAILLQK